MITTYKLYEYILLHRLVNPLKNKYNTLYQLIFWRIIDTYWYHAYEFIRFYGLKHYLHMGGKHNLNDDGIQYAIDYYNNYRENGSQLGSHPSHDDYGDESIP
jgi:hypothetical protein